MEDILLTVLFLGMAVLLFAIRYILPLVILVVGIVLLKKKRKKIGFFLIVIGGLLELFSILAQIVSFM